jgi:nucleotide-binding universal stress UspA family protein
MLDSLLREKFPEDAKLAEIRQVVELGSSARSIVEKAESEAVDRIVLATHGRTGLDHWLLGSVSEKVIARAPCPVVVIPAHRRKPGKAA